MIIVQNYTATGETALLQIKITPLSNIFISKTFVTYNSQQTRKINMKTHKQSNTQFKYENNLYL